MGLYVETTLEQRIQQVLDEYRPNLYMDGGDVKMLGACIDCPISLLTMKLGIQRLLKEHFPEITGVNAITDVSLNDLYDREAVMQKTIFRSNRT
jgi:Fe-S cluster biogenesis protein NfuA